MEHARALVEADHGPSRVVGLGVEREHVLHVSDEVGDLPGGITHSFKRWGLSAFF